MRLTNSLTNSWGRTLCFTATVALVSVAIMSCCKKKKKEEDPPTPQPTIATATPELPATETEQPAVEAPDWKTKCPGAVNRLNGSVALPGATQVYKEPKTSAEKLVNLKEGTWVNLLGSVGTWTCVDYPCAAGTLCPAWIESHNVKAIAKPDAGKSVATKPDAGKDDAGKKNDASKQDAGQLVRPPILSDRIREHLNRIPNKDGDSPKRPPIQIK